MTATGRLRLLHTSDIHVAGDQPSREGLRWVVETANGLGVDVVLIAGDLFDSARVPEAAVDETVGQLGRLEMPAVVIPGNHDCVDARSIYHRVDFTAAGPHVRFAGDPAGELVRFDDLGLCVWARGIEDHHPGHRPLDGRPDFPDGYWRVVLTHGHFVTTTEDLYRSSPIRPEEIAELACDYLALGHWHRFVDVSQGPVRAAYSGSPSEGAGAVLVALDPESGIQMERVGVTTP